MMIFGVVLLLCGVGYMLQESPILSTSNTYILENSSLEFTCYAHMNASKTRWGTLDRADQYSYLTFAKEGPCKVSGFLSETKYFENICYSNATFKVKIKRVNNSNHDQEWYCSHNYSKSNIASIYVQVPTKYVRFKNISGDTIETVEMTKIALTCETSEGRPVANITWKKVSRTGITTVITNVVAYNISKREILSENNMIIVQSSIDIFPLREDNDTRIICQASNMEFTMVEKEVTFTVHYPPSVPLFFVNGSNVNGSIDIISGKNVSVLCRSDSYPYPSYIWNSASSEYAGQYLNTSTIIGNDTITGNDTWQCTVTNNMTFPNKSTISGKSSAKLEVHLCCKNLSCQQYFENIFFI